MTDSVDKLCEAAKELGYDHGLSKAAIVENIVTAKQSADNILKGYQENNPTVLELCPKPLSGEWAGDPVPMAILDEIANKLEDPQAFKSEDIDLDSVDILDAYESAFEESFWEKTISICTKVSESGTDA